MDIIKIPFDKTRFATEFKQCASGVDTTIDYANIESSLAKVATMIEKIIGADLYMKICAFAANAGEIEQKAKGYLQRSVAHFALSEHEIYLITRIGNKGITVEKNEQSTTVFKYLQDQLSNDLISTGWYWMNMLIDFLNENKTSFPDWKPDTADNVPIDMSDFDRWVGVSDSYFLIVAKWLIREVWNDCVLSRIKEPVKDNTIARAVCYEVMARACVRMAYMNLPSPIRLDISNEMSKNHNAQEDKRIREVVSAEFRTKAKIYWADLDLELKKKAVSESQKQITDRPVLGEKNITQGDKFYFS